MDFVYVHDSCKIHYGSREADWINGQISKYFVRTKFYENSPFKTKIYIFYKYKFIFKKIHIEISGIIFCTQGFIILFTFDKENEFDFSFR